MVILRSSYCGWSTSEVGYTLIAACAEFDRRNAADDEAERSRGVKQSLSWRAHWPVVQECAEPLE
jgi:hypothetical protein